MLLRNSRYKGSLSFDEVLRMAQDALTTTEDDDKRNFIEMVQTAALLTK